MRTSKNDGQSLSDGVAHKLPHDFKKALTASPAAHTAWQDITPLARNEWICWVITVKLAETRTHHIKRAVNELAQGKRRPCCWMGCMHRTDKTYKPDTFLGRVKNQLTK